MRGLCLTQHTIKNVTLTSETIHIVSRDRDAVPEDGLSTIGRMLGAAVVKSVGTCVGVSTGGGDGVVGK